MTWHQFWSSSSVVTTMSARAAPGDRSLTVTMAVRAPAVRHAARAAFVAGVPPSWETPITRPLLTGSSDSSSAWTLASVAVGRPAVRSASRRISTPASDPCSDVPQPVTRIGWPAAAASRIAAASTAAGAGRSRQGRQQAPRDARFGLDHLGHVVRRPGAQRGHPGARPRVGRPGQRCVRIEGEVTHGGQHTGAPGTARMTTQPRTRHHVPVEGWDRRRSGCRLA